MGPGRAPRAPVVPILIYHCFQRLCNSFVPARVAPVVSILIYQCCQWLCNSFAPVQLAPGAAVILTKYGACRHM